MNDACSYLFVTTYKYDEYIEIPFTFKTIWKKSVWLSPLTKFWLCDKINRASRLHVESLVVSKSCRIVSAFSSSEIIHKSNWGNIYNGDIIIIWMKGKVSCSHFRFTVYYIAGPTTGYNKIPNFGTYWN